MAENDEQHENYTFESADAGSSLTFPMQCSALRKNGHVMIKGHPCKIVDMSTSKTGKHGHAKVHLVAIDIFTKAKYEDLSPSTHNMDVPNVSKKEYLLLDLDSGPGGFLSLMNDDGTEKEDVKTPEGDDPDVQKLRQRLIDAHKNGTEAYVLVLSAMGQEAAIEVKEKSTS